MHNTYLYNRSLYNGLGRVFGQNEQDRIVFNDYGLLNDTVIATELLDSVPTRDVDSVSVPRGNGQILLNEWWRVKQIRIKGYIRCDTAAELEAEIDQMKYKMSQREGNLDIKVDGVVRRYVATLTNDDIFDDRKGYNITTVPWKMTFTCMTPFATLPDYTSFDFLTQTDMSLEEQVENEGTTSATPILIFNISAANSVSALTWTNEETDESITVTRSIVAGDYIRIDGENKEVKVNGTVVDYTGTFPKIAVGVNPYTLTFTGTSITYSHTIKFLQPYL